MTRKHHQYTPLSGITPGLAQAERAELRRREESQRQREHLLEAQQLRAENDMLRRKAPDPVRDAAQAAIAAAMIYWFWRLPFLAKIFIIAIFALSMVLIKTMDDEKEHRKRFSVEQLPNLTGAMDASAELMPEADRISVDQAMALAITRTPHSPLRWQNTKTLHQGYVTLVGPTPDEHGCRQFRVTRDTPAELLSGLVDYCG